MTVKNKYVKHAHISEAKFRQIILLFSEDLSATQISHLTKVSRPTVNKYLTAIRLRILELSLLQSGPLVGQIEVDESFFGARGSSHINGIKSFCGYAKNRFVRFK
jgi:transposase